MSFPFRGQKDAKDCGHFCLLMTLKFHGVNINIGSTFFNTIYDIGKSGVFGALLEESQKRLAFTLHAE